MKEFVNANSSRSRPARDSHHTDVTSRTSEQLWIAPRYRDRLQAAGLERLDDFINTTNGRLLRRLPDRENWRIGLPASNGSHCGAFLKRHRSRTVRGWLRAQLRLGPGRTAGPEEARCIRDFERDGIPTMSLIAFGERLTAGGTLSSFVMTEELAGFTQLDEFLGPRFANPARPTVDGLCQLVADVADLASRFHRKGYNHRDFYSCHVFGSEPETCRFELRLIDLQRVQQRHWFRRRWVVKDLAQLAYSVPDEIVGRGRRMAFMRRYLGVSRLRPRDKRFIRSILARQRRMQRQLGGYR